MRGRQKGKAVKLLADHAGDFEAQLNLCVYGWQSVDPKYAEIYRLVNFVWNNRQVKGMPTPILPSHKVSPATFSKMMDSLTAAENRLAEITAKAVLDGDTATLERIVEVKKSVANEKMVDHFRLLILFEVDDAAFMGRAIPTLSELIELVNPFLPEAKDERDFRRALKELGIKLPASTKKRGASENRKLA